MRGPYEHDHKQFIKNNCPACAWDMGAKAGVGLAKERLILLQNKDDGGFEGLDWSDVDFILEWKG